MHWALGIEEIVLKVECFFFFSLFSKNGMYSFFDTRNVHAKT